MEEVLFYANVFFAIGNTYVWREDHDAINLVAAILNTGVACCMYYLK